jgi:hypothetical protein
MLPREHAKLFSPCAVPPAFTEIDVPACRHLKPPTKAGDKATLDALDQAASLPVSNVRRGYAGFDCRMSPSDKAYLIHVASVAARNNVIRCEKAGSQHRRSVLCRPRAGRSRCLLRGRKKLCRGDSCTQKGIHTDSGRPLCMFHESRRVRRCASPACAAARDVASSNIWAGGDVSRASASALPSDELQWLVLAGSGRQAFDPSETLRLLHGADCCSD